MFAVAEVAILVLALLLAVLRSLRGPAFFPLRALAVVFIDLFRGVPLLLVILLLGFGVPALDLPGVPRSDCSGASTAMTLSYSALHRGDLPLGHRLGARDPSAPSARALGPHPVADAAVRGAPPGRAQRDPGAA